MVFRYGLTLDGSRGKVFILMSFSKQNSRPRCNLIFSCVRLRWYSIRPKNISRIAGSIRRAYYTILLRAYLAFKKPLRCLINAWFLLFDFVTVSRRLCHCWYGCVPNLLLPRLLQDLPIMSPDLSLISAFVQQVQTILSLFIILG